jgi:glyoxylase-like metal-dependent hydrolase (beta-lactamase superfamily II)
VGPTHTRGDTGIFVSADGVLFSGDVVMNESFVAANAGSSITAWLAAFDTFEAMRPTTIVPSHGPIGDGSSIQLLRAIVLRIRAQAAAYKAAGVSADEAAATIQSEVAAEHPSWPRANGIAALARSAWAEAP